MSDAVRVLIVEDDETIGAALRNGLMAADYQVRWTRTGGSALAEARTQPPDVVLLDLGLPDLDGVEVARTLRAELREVLIVILTARDQDIDVVVGLDAGADDYLTKPVGLTVLLARLRAHLRTRPAAASTAPLRCGELVVDPGTRECTVGGQPIPLRPKEFELLLALAAAPGTAVSREQLMSQVWDENWFGSTKTLDVTMAALRKALAAAAGRGQPPVVTTLRGYGYRLEPPPSGAGR